MQSSIPSCPFLNRETSSSTGATPSSFTPNGAPKALGEKGLLYIGTGVSGGEEGARKGPAIMPGGPVESWELVKPIFEAIAAKVNGEPCVTHIGKGGAGHYVKMVHNGIEYGDMQLICEAYQIFKAAGFSAAEMARRLQSVE